MVDDGREGKPLCCVCVAHARPDGAEHPQDLNSDAQWRSAPPSSVDRGEELPALVFAEGFEDGVLERDALQRALLPHGMGTRSEIRPCGATGLEL